MNEHNSQLNVIPRQFFKLSLNIQDTPHITEELSKIIAPKTYQKTILDKNFAVYNKYSVNK